MLDPKDDKAVDVHEVTRDLKSEKETIAADLRDWSNNIEHQIGVIDIKIAKASNKTRTSLKEQKTRLRKEKSKVDKSLKEIEKSTEKSWDDVRKRSSEILTEAKIETQKIGERIEDLID
jgi:hypothetical protein